MVSFLLVHMKFIFFGDWGFDYMPIPLAILLVLLQVLAIAKDEEEEGKSDKD